MSLVVMLLFALYSSPKPLVQSISLFVFVELISPLTYDHKAIYFIALWA